MMSNNVLPKSLLLFIYLFFYRFLLCWTILQLRVCWTSSSSTTRQTVSPSTSVDEAARKVLGGGRWGCSSTLCWRDKAAFVAPPVTKFYLRSRSIHLYLCQWNYLNQSVIISSWGLFIEGFFFSFSLCSFPAFCWANQTLVWLKPELHSPGDCSDFSFSIQQATTLMCFLCQKMSLLHLS